jgi:hypothetical protein
MWQSAIEPLFLSGAVRAQLNLGHPVQLGDGTKGVEFKFSMKGGEFVVRA